jgi:hypothetical protein
MSKFITRNNAEGLCEQALVSKFFELSNDLKRSQQAAAGRPFILASLETVEAELNRKRARKAPAPGC